MRNRSLLLVIFVIVTVAFVTITVFNTIRYEETALSTDLPEINTETTPKLLV